MKKGNINSESTHNNLSNYTNINTQLLKEVENICMSEIIDEKDNQNAELKKLDAEKIIEETLNDLNENNLSKNSNRNFKVAINLSDDLKGGWTNRFTSDYDSKYKINGLFSRNFCTPIFWSSEIFTEDIIRQRTLEYTFRTVYWLNNPKPKTLKIGRAHV